MGGRVLQIYSSMMNLKHEGKLRQRKREKGREGDLVIQVSSFSKRNKKNQSGTLGPLPSP